MLQYTQNLGMLHSVVQSVRDSRGVRSLAHNHESSGPIHANLTIVWVNFYNNIQDACLYLLHISTMLNIKYAIVGRDVTHKRTAPGHQLSLVAVQVPTAVWLLRQSTDPLHRYDHRSLTDRLQPIQPC